MTQSANHSQWPVQHVMCATVGWVALLTLAIGAMLTVSSAFAGGLAASANPLKPAHAARAAYVPVLTNTPIPTSTPGPCDPVCSLAPGSHDILNDVAAVSANDVWAVGRFNRIEHWDGMSWSVVPSPSGGTPYGVAAVAANDVWAVGCCRSGNTTLIEHWDGISWSVVPNPNPGSVNYLYGVEVVSGTDVWAVGFYGPLSGATHTLVEHWDGTSWSVVQAPTMVRMEVSFME